MRREYAVTRESKKAAAEHAVSLRCTGGEAEEGEYPAAAFLGDEAQLQSMGVRWG